MKISIDRYVSLVRVNPDNIGNGLYDLVLTEQNFKNLKGLINKLDKIQAWKLNLSEEVTNRIKEGLINEVIEELKETNNITGYRTRELNETKVIMFKLLNNNSFQKEIDKKIVQTMMSNEKLTKEQKQESIETYLSNIEIKEQIQFLSENPKYLTNLQVKRITNETKNNSYYIRDNKELEEMLSNLETLNKDYKNTQIQEFIYFVKLTSDFYEYEKKEQEKSEINKKREEEYEGSILETNKIERINYSLTNKKISNYMDDYLKDNQKDLDIEKFLIMGTISREVIEKIEEYPELEKYLLDDFDTFNPEDRQMYMTKCVAAVEDGEKIKPLYKEIFNKRLPLIDLNSYNFKKVYEVIETPENRIKLIVNRIKREKERVNRVPQFEDFEISKEEKEILQQYIDSDKVEVLDLLQTELLNQNEKDKLYKKINNSKIVTIDNDNKNGSMYSNNNLYKTAMKIKVERFLRLNDEGFFKQEGETLNEEQNNEIEDLFGENYFEKKPYTIKTIIEEIEDKDDNYTLRNKGIRYKEVFGLYNDIQTEEDKDNVTKIIEYLDSNKRKDFNGYGLSKTFVNNKTLQNRVIEIIKNEKNIEENYTIKYDLNSFLKDIKIRNEEELKNIQIFIKKVSKELVNKLPEDSTIKTENYFMKSLLQNTSLFLKEYFTMDKTNEVLNNYVSQIDQLKEKEEDSWANPYYAELMEVTNQIGNKLEIKVQELLKDITFNEITPKGIEELKKTPSQTIIKIIDSNYGELSVYKLFLERLTELGLDEKVIEFLKSKSKYYLYQEIKRGKNIITNNEEMKEIKKLIGEPFNLEEISKLSKEHSNYNNEEPPREIYMRIIQAHRDEIQQGTPIREAINEFFNITPEEEKAIIKSYILSHDQGSGHILSEYKDIEELSWEVYNEVVRDSKNDKGFYTFYHLLEYLEKTKYTTPKTKQVEYIKDIKDELIDMVVKSDFSSKTSFLEYLIMLFPEDKRLQEEIYNQRFEIKLNTELKGKEREPNKDLENRYKDFYKSYQQKIKKDIEKEEDFFEKDNIKQIKFNELSKEEQEKVFEVLREKNVSYKKIENTDNEYLNSFFEEAEFFYVKNEKGEYEVIDFILTNKDTAYYQSYSNIIDDIPEEKKDYLAIERFKTITKSARKQYEDILAQKQIEFLEEKEIEIFFYPTPNQEHFSNNTIGVEYNKKESRNENSFQKAVGYRPLNASDIERAMYTSPRYMSDRRYPDREDYLVSSYLYKDNFDNSKEYLNKRIEDKKITIKNRLDLIKNKHEEKEIEITEPIDLLEIERKEYTESDRLDPRALRNLYLDYPELREEICYFLENILSKGEKKRAINTLYKNIVMEMIEGENIESLKRINEELLKPMIKAVKKEETNDLQFLLRLIENYEYYDEEIEEYLLETYKKHNTKENEREVLIKIQRISPEYYEYFDTIEKINQAATWRFMLKIKDDHKDIQVKIEEILTSILKSEQDFQTAYKLFPEIKEEIKKVKSKTMIKSKKEEEVSNVTLEESEMYSLSIDKIDLSLYSDLELFLLDSDNMEGKVLEIFDVILKSESGSLDQVDKIYEELTLENKKMFDKIKSLDNEGNDFVKERQELLDEINQLKEQNGKEDIIREKDEQQKILMKKINLNIKIIKEIKSQMYPDINVKIKLFLQSIKPEYLETLLEDKKEVQTSTQEIKGYKQQVWDFDTLKEEPTNQKLDETMFDMKKFEKLMDTFKNSKIQEVEKRGKKEKVIKRDYKSIKEFEQLSGYELDYSLNEDNQFIENSILFKEDIIEDNYKDTMKGSINKHFNINKFKEIFIDDTKVKTIVSKREKFKQVLEVFAYEHNVSLGNLNSNYNEEVLDLLLLNFPQNSKEEKLYNNLYNDKNKIKMIKDFNDRKTRLIKRFENLTTENRRKYVSDKDSAAFILVSVTEEGLELLKEIEEGFDVITKTKQRIKDLIKIKKPNVESSLQEDTMIEYFKYVTFDELHSMQQGVLNNVEPKILSKFFIGYLKEIRKREEEGVEFNFREFKMFFERLEELVEIERQNGNEPTEENYKFDYKLSKEILEANLIETDYPELRPILMNVLNSVSASGVEEFEGISKRKMEKYDEYRYTQKEEKFKDPNMPLTKRLKEVINPKTKQKDFYIVEMMHSKDPRVLFTGEATDCCRIAHGVGESHIDFEIENNDITGTLLFSKLKPNISQKEIERLKENLDKYNELLEKEGNTEEVVFGKEATTIYETLISSGLIVGMGSSWRNGNQLTLNNVETKKRDQEQLTGYHLEEENGEIFRVKLDDKEHLGSGRLKSESESINITDSNGNRIIVRYEKEGNNYKEKKTMRINDIENEIIELNKSYIEDINEYIERIVRNSEDIQFVLKTEIPEQLVDEDIEKYERGVKEISKLPLYVTMGDAYGSNVVKRAYQQVEILDTDKQYIPVKKVRNGKNVYTDTRSQLLIGGYKNNVIDFNQIKTIKETIEQADLDYIIEGLKPLINKEELSKENKINQDLK